MKAFSSGSYLGVDIGASGIKIVELKKEAGAAKLLSYGFSENKTSEIKTDWKSDKERTAKVINEICKRAGMVSRNAIVALPTFSVFSSVLTLSNVSQKDISSAVHWEAKKIIPLPLDEMILDWKKIENPNPEDKNVKLFLTGAPRSLVKKYVEIFKEARINLLSIETETFSLIRSLLGGDKSTVMIVEIGANTTDISIIHKGIPMISRSIDVGGLTITKSIAGNLNIGTERAEQFKYDMGVSLDGASAQGVIPKTITETLSTIINEIKYTMNLFETKNNLGVEKVILSGGSSLLDNLPEYLTRILDKNVIVGNPWARISYPVDLKPTLDQIGPRMAVAIGLAIREIE